MSYLEKYLPKDDAETVAAEAEPVKPPAKRSATPYLDKYLPKGQSSGESPRHLAELYGFAFQDTAFEEQEAKKSLPYFEEQARGIEQQAYENSRLENLQNMGEFRRGLNRGIEGVKSAFHAGRALFNQVTGDEAERNRAFADYQAAEDRASLYPATVESFTEIGEHNGWLSDAADYVVSSLGELAPTMAEAAVGSAIGAAVGSAVPGAGTATGGVSGFLGRRAVKKAAAAFIEKQIKKGVVKEAAQELAEKVFTAEAKKLIQKQAVRSAGAKAGMVGATWQMETGGNYGEAVDAVGFEDASVGAAVATGLAAASLEVLGGQARVIDRVLGPEAGTLFKKALESRDLPWAGRIAKEALTQAPQEFAQEAGQEFMAAVNLALNDAGPGLVSPETGMRLAEAGMKGAVGGGFSGAVTGAFSWRAEQPRGEKAPGLETAPAARQLNPSAEQGPVPAQVEAAPVEPVPTAPRGMAPAPAPAVTKPKPAGPLSKAVERAPVVPEFVPRSEAARETAREKYGLWSGPVVPAPVPAEQPVDMETGELELTDEDRRILDRLDDENRGGVSDDLPELREEAGEPQEVPPVRGVDVASPAPVVEVKGASADSITFVVDGQDVTLRPGPGQSPDEFKAAVRGAAGLPISQAFRTLNEKFGGAVAEGPAELDEVQGSPTPLDAQAHEAASSPSNDRPEPTPAQIEAGNYKVGRLKLHGLDISIENPAGSVRKGTDETGRQWQTDLKQHYGYFRGVVGRDGDNVDVFVKPGIDQSTAGDKVFVVDQKNVKTGGFDEHKVLMGFDSVEEAREAYLSNYDETGPGRIGAITEVGVEDFKRWLREGDTKRPFGEASGEVETSPESSVGTAEPAPKVTYPAMKQQAKAAGMVLSPKQKDGSFLIYKEGALMPLRAVDLAGVRDYLATLKTEPAEKEASKGTNRVAPRWDYAKGVLEREKNIVTALSALKAQEGTDISQWGDDTAAYEIIKDAARVMDGSSRSVVAALRPFIIQRSDGAVLAKEGMYDRVDELFAYRSDALLEAFDRALEKSAPEFKKKGETAKPAAEPKDEPVSPEGMTLLEARNLLISLRTQAENDGRVTDARLLDKIGQVENLVKELEAEQEPARPEARKGVSFGVFFGRVADRIGHNGKLKAVAPGSDAQNFFIAYKDAYRKAVTEELRYSVGQGANVAEAHAEAMGVGEEQLRAYADAFYREHEGGTKMPGREPVQEREPAPKPQSEEKPQAQKAEGKPKEGATGAQENTVFTEDAYQKARARMRERLSRVHSGFDPELLQDGLTIAGYHLERGARKFGVYAKAMVEEFGEGIKPYLKAFYNGVRDLPGIVWTAEMDDYQAVQGFDLEKVDSSTEPDIVANEKQNTPESQEETDGERAGVGDEGAEALGEVPAGENPRAESGGAVRDGKPGRGKTGGGGNRNADEKRVSGARGRRGRSADVHSPQAGALEPAPSNLPAANFVITDEVDLGKGSEGVKFADNLAAIRALKEIERDNRRATAEEQRLLARYVGWGGLSNAFADEAGQFKPGWEERGAQLAELLSEAELKAARRSTRNAHYTSQAIVDAMWQAVQGMGFNRGMVLEPSAGTGNFLGLAPADIEGRFVAVEYDSLTARIAGALYPQSTVLHSGFQKLAFPDNAFDLAIGNPPFGSESLLFQYKPHLKGYSIHNQFFMASMEALKPGGLQAMVVSRYLLDAKDSGARLKLAEQAKLLGAIRLPDTAFKENARTEVVTDIVFLQKLTAEEQAEMEEAVQAFRAGAQRDAQKERERQALAARVPDWVQTAEVADPLGGEAMTVNRYFAKNPQMIVGTLERSGSTRRGEAEINVRLGGDFEAELEKRLEELPKDVAQPAAALEAVEKRYRDLSDALRISLEGLEHGSIVFDKDDRLFEVIERETPEGAYEFAKRELSPTAPWSNRLIMAADGKWYTLDDQLDEQGNKVKVLDDKGKSTRLNAKVRNVYESEEQIPDSLRLGASRFERLVELVKIRDLLKRQLVLEATDATKAEMEGNRKRLAAAYDGFVAKHGFLNDGKNEGLIREMPDGALIVALELGYRPELTAAKAKRLGEEPRGADAKKAPILSERVVVPYEPPGKADSAADALVISMAESGRVDMERLAALLDTDEAGVVAALHGELADPLIFHDPELNAWQTRDQYLSGQVKRKLAAAREANLEKNVAALEKVQPEPWSADQVTAVLGATWIPADVYAAFIEHLTGEKGTVSFSRATNSYAVSVPSTAKGRDWGTEDASLSYILNQSMNSLPIRLTYTDSEGKTHFMAAETELALMKAKQLGMEFGDWIFAEGDRRRRLVELFNEKFNVRVQRQYDGQHLFLPGKVPDQIIQMRRHQKNAIWRGIQERFMLLDHVVGAGKAQPLDAKVLTPDGWKLMGDIQPGDQVISVDGKPTLVEAVFPQGEKDIYRVVFSDGSSTECCEEHLWLTQNYRERGYAQRAVRENKEWECGQAKVRSLAEIKETLVAKHLGAKNHSVPMVAPVQFEAKDVPIAPYLMGVLLGDGGMSHGGVSITTMDEEIIQECAGQLPPGVKLGRVATGERCPTWTITNETSVGRASGGKVNPVKVALEELGLRGVSSHEKFIPDGYLFNSVEARIELLRGLMDTDGSVSRRGHSTYFYTCSRALADGVTTLVQSLGGTVRRGEKRPTYRHGGEVRSGRLCFVLCVKMPAGINPFRLGRKADVVVEKGRYAPARYIVAVEPVGKKPAQCIRVEHSSHLYVTDDFIVTHNTFTAIARAMERRRMGLSRKPMIVVPNHMVEQFAADIYRLYPGAKLLAAGKKDFESKNRRRLFAKIATGDWDVVVVPHSSFKFISISPEAEERYLAEEIRIAKEAIDEAWEEAEAQGLANGRRRPFNVKQAEALAEKLENKLSGLKAKKTDRLLTFEQLGVDDMIIDEAHEFKNLFYSSRMTGVRGMGDRAGSEKAYDLYQKVRVLRDSPTGSVVFMTGTPISNSAVEMYTMMRYLAGEDLRELGLEHFDAWRAQFVDASTAWEPTESGRLKEVTRLGRSWSNMRSLMDLYYSFTDAVPLEDIKTWYEEDNDGQKFPVPKVKGAERAKVVVPPTPAQAELLTEILSGFEGLENISDPNQRNAERLRLMDRARKVSLDARAVDPTLQTAEEGGKLEAVSREVKRLYDQWKKDKGTQLVFLDRSVPKAKGDDKALKEYDKIVAERDAALARDDERAYMAAVEKLEKFDENEIAELRKAQAGGWNAYQQIKDSLVAQGIPAKEIRFIQEATTDEQKQALFDAVNAGEVRVLLGSTPRMGAGTNVQQRLVALHHVDVTWKPSDIEQREGRIIRQGNRLLEKYGIEGFEVEILAYATERTVDAKMWDLNATKLRTINGIRKYSGEFTMEFEDEEAVGMAEIAALASGDPLLLERVKLDSEIGRLDMLRRGWSRQAMALRDRVDDAQRDVDALPGRIERMRGEADSLAEALGEQQAQADARTITVEGRTYGKRMEAHKAIEAAVAEQQDGNDKARYAVEVNGEKLTSKAALEKALEESLGDAVPFAMTIGEAEVISRGAAARELVKKANELAEQMTRSQSGSKTARVGSWLGRGLDLDVEERFGGAVATLSLVDAKGHTIESVHGGVSEVKKGNLVNFSPQYVRNLISNFDGAIKQLSTGSSYRSLERRLADAQKSLPELKKQLESKAGFPQQEELEQKRERLEEVVRILAGKKAEQETEQETEQEAGVNEVPKFARRGRGSVVAALSDVEFDAVLKRITVGIKDPVAREGFVVVPTARALPPRILAEIEKQGNKPEEIDGVFHNGKVYLVREHITSAERLEEILFHEWHGHAGLYGMFGNDGAKLKAEMAKLYDLITPKRLFPVGRKYGINLMRYGHALAKAEYDLETRKAIMMEEMLAFLTQEYSRGTIARKVRELIGRIRAWLREHGFANLAEWGENDIAFLLKRARVYAEAGGWAKGGEAVAVSGPDILRRLREAGISDEMLTKLVAGAPRFAEGMAQEPVEGVSPEGDEIRFALRDKARAAGEFAKKFTPDKSGLPYAILSGKILPERMKAAVGSVLSNPHYGSQKSKYRTKAYDLALERGANANEIKYEVMARQEDYEGLEGVREQYRKAGKAEREMVDQLLVEGDIRGEEYSGRDLDGHDNPLGKQVPEKVKRAYLAFRQTITQATATMFDRLGRLRLLPYEESPFYQELIDLLDENLSPDEVAKRFGIHEKAVEAYLKIRRSRQALDDATRPYKNQAWYSTLRDALLKGLSTQQVQHEFGNTPDLVKAFIQIKRDGLPALATAEQYRKAAWYKILNDLLTKGDDHPMLQKLEIYNAYRGVKEYDGQLAKLKEQWGQVKGYLPRIRKDGEQHVKVWRVEEDGTFTEVWMQPAKTEFGANRLRDTVEKNLKEYIPHSFDPEARYEVVVEPNTATPEEIFLGIGSHRAIEGLLSKVFDKATDAGILENSLEVQRQVLSILADEISARGFGRHRLHRSEHLIEGYETQNTPAVLAQFVGGMAGWLSKSEFAMRANKLMSQIPATRPHDKSWVREYVDDALKNSTYIDQWFGTARSFAALMYLGFKASSAMLNATQNYIWGQAKLSKHTPWATGKLLKAQHDVIKDHLLVKAGKPGVLSEEERWVLEEGLRRGRTHANYVRAMAGMDDNGGVLGKGQAGVRWLAEKAMIPFQAVETYWNREPALLAAYRVFKAQGMDQHEALKQAERFVDDVHFVVGKENIPAMLRKMGPLGRTLYTFQSYTHNYLLGMLTSLKKGEFEVVARSLTALVLFGGLAALPFGDDLDKWYRRIFGERPLRMLDKWLRETAGQYTDFGDQIADFVLHGAPALGGVNFSRAIGVNIPWFSPEDESLAERLTGVWGGLVQKGRFASMAAARGDAGRAVEFMAPEALANILRGYRHYADGATTLTGRPVFGDDGRQVRYTAGEAAIRAFGFMPLEPSKQTQSRWDARRARDFWTERKADVLARFRTATDRKQAMTEVRQFNRELRQAPGGVLVPPITMQTLRQALRAKPDKRELLYHR